MKKPVYKSVLDFKPAEWPSFDAAQQKEAFDLLFSSYNATFRDGIVVGINECTDLVNDLDLLLVCKEDAKPSVLVQHLPLLAYLNQVNIATLPVGSSSEVGNLLTNDFNVKRVLCFGIRKGRLLDFQDKIKQIFQLSAPKVPTEYLPIPTIKQIPVGSTK